MTPANQIRLVRAAQSGDHAAFKELLDHFSPRLYGYAIALCRNAQDAEDCCQETYMAAWLKIGQLQDPLAFYEWVRRILYNMFTTSWRKRKITPRPAEIEDEVQDDRMEVSPYFDELTPDETVQRIVDEYAEGHPKTAPKILAILACLNDTSRTTTGYNDAAAILGIPVHHCHAYHHKFVVWAATHCLEHFWTEDDKYLGKIAEHNLATETNRPSFVRDGERWAAAWKEVASLKKYSGRALYICVVLLYRRSGGRIDWDVIK